jgi:hypothetical protein
MSRRGLALALLLSACVAPPPPAEPDLAPKPAPPKPAAAPAPPPIPANAEVELSGKIVVPKEARGTPKIFVADGECWKPTTRAFGSATPQMGTWFVEVFVPQGTKLWVCAAVEPPAGKPGKVVYSAALARNPLEGRGIGEVEYGQLELVLAKGPAVELPKPR